MVNNVAYIVDQIYTITGNSPVKKALQKTIYLLEQKGVDLGFKYILHFYGPYCAELDQETAELNAEGIIHFDYGRFGHRMTVNKECEESIMSDLSDSDQNTIHEVIERYRDKTPSDLELLTTAIYAYKHTNSETVDEIVYNVKEIKGQKYNDREIRWALNEFPYFNIALSASLDKATV
jgi:uncharacterized protein YwgA|nr:type II toxin-antitoxin system antitoxin SocA domain-containing protein [Acutalibacter muris]